MVVLDRFYRNHLNDGGCKYTENKGILLCHCFYIPCGDVPWFLLGITIHVYSISSAIGFTVWDTIFVTILTVQEIGISTLSSSQPTLSELHCEKACL